MQIKFKIINACIQNESLCGTAMDQLLSKGKVLAEHIYLVCITAHCN